MFMSFSLIAQNDFAFNLQEQLEKTTGSNFLFSPTSIKTAFAMAYEGSRGMSQQEIEKVFGFQVDNSAFFNEKSQLDSVAKIANSIWVQQGLKLLPSYTDKLSNHFGAEPQFTNFMNEPEASAQKINDWIEANTNGMIKKMLSPSDVKSFKVALVNAIYFKEDWKFPFNKDLTKDDTFSNFNGSTSDIQMMHAQQRFRAFDGNLEKVIELPYEDEKTSMVIILPKDMEKYELNQSVYAGLLGNLRNQEVILDLPKFEFETPTVDLIPHLGQLGMNNVFSNAANFSGMSEEIRMKIGKVLHKAKIIVNEEGTEAAAVTVIGMVFTTSISAPPPPPLRIRVDQPFYYIIKDNTTGAILFMGKMNEM